jgi:hypothetical protein
VDQKLSAGAVRVIDIIRNQQTCVCVNAHVLLKTLLFASQKHQVGKDLAAKNSSTACRRVGPSDRPFAVSGGCMGKIVFQFVDVVKELSAFGAAQVLDFFEQVVRAHERIILRIRFEASRRQMHRCTSFLPACCVACLVCQCAACRNSPPDGGLCCVPGSRSATLPGAKSDQSLRPPCAKTFYLF